MKVATLEAQVSVIKSEPPVRLAHFSPYPPGWRRMIAVYLYIYEKNTRACLGHPELDPHLQDGSKSDEVFHMNTCFSELVNCRSISNENFRTDAQRDQPQSEYPLQ